MTALAERLLALWQQPVDGRADPEAAFRELYADPVSINGVETPVSALVDRARALQQAFADLTIEVVDHVETPTRVVFAFYLRARHAGPLATPLGNVEPTGRSVEIRTIDVLTVANGLVTALWVVADDLGMLTQLDSVGLHPR